MHRIPVARADPPCAVNVAVAAAESGNVPSEAVRRPAMRRQRAVPPVSLSVMMRTRGGPGTRPRDLAGASGPGGIAPEDPGAAPLEELAGAPGPGGIAPGAHPILFFGAGM